MTLCSFYFKKGIKRLAIGSCYMLEYLSVSNEAIWYQEVIVMPNIKSAIKRVKTTEKKTIANKITKSAIRTSVKKAKVAIESAASDATTVVKQAVISIDKAAAKGYMHKNTAARKKSRLAKAVNALK